MKKNRKPHNFVRKPSYIGGKQALDQFIKAHLVYPEEAIVHKITGFVTVAYDLNYKGEVIKAEVKRSLGYGCDEEALRIVKMLRYHVAKNRNVKVTFHKTINIHFRPPVSQPKKEITPSSSYQYTYVPSKKDEKPKKSPYTIQINLPPEQ